MTGKDDVDRILEALIRAGRVIVSKDSEGRIVYKLVQS